MEQVNVDPGPAAEWRESEVSQRKLERHFREALGTTPLAAGRLIRVERAKHVLRKHRDLRSAAAADGNLGLEIVT